MTDDQLVNEWTRNVVLITGPDGKAHGSGFVVRRAGALSHVVTCAHVVSDLGGKELQANGRPATVLYDGTADGIDLAALAVEGLTEEVQTLTRGAQVGDEVVAIGFTRVDRGRRASARPATIREATQLTYEPQKVKKHPGWLLALSGDQITDGFSGGPVIDVRTGMVVGVLGLRGAGTADAIAISNLSAWRDAPPAVSPVRDELAQLRRLVRLVPLAALLLALAAFALTIYLVLRPSGRLQVVVEPPDTGSGSGTGTGSNRRSWLDLIQRDEVVTVQASAGWQVGYASYAKNQKLCLGVRGRVNVAANDLDNLAALGRNILATFAAPGTALARFRTTYPPPEWSKYNAFRWHWTGPAGMRLRDGMLDDCLLRASSGWGALLMIEVPDEDDPSYEQRDPLEVLDTLRVGADTILPITTGRTYTMASDGKLAFIVNDAVLSELSKQAICREAFEALGRAKAARADDPQHVLDLEPRALFPYSDNVGGFQIRLGYGSCDERRNRDFLRPAGGSGAVPLDETLVPLAPPRDPTPEDAGVDARRGRTGVTLP